LGIAKKDWILKTGFLRLYYKKVSDTSNLEWWIIWALL